MKKLILFLALVLLVTVFAGCSAVHRTNTPDATRKSDNATPKPNKEQETVIEMD